MRADIKGIVVPVVTPFTKDGKVNEEAYRCLLDYFIGEGVDGFWVCGAAGEGVLLTDDERARMAELSAAQVNGRAKTIMHVGAPALQSAMWLAKKAAAAKVDAIASTPPLLYKPDDDGVVRYFQTLAAATDLPIFVYNLPSMAPIEISAALMEKLVRAVPQIGGVKHSAPTFANILAFDKLGITVFTGSSALLLPALTIGAVGCIGSPLNIAPRLHVDIYRAWREGKLAEAQEKQRRAADISVFSFGQPYIAMYKAVLSERLGTDMGTPRPPLPALTLEQRVSALKTVKELGAI